MITSFKGGVGKSTVTANLGSALAGRGRRVLLCDCDFRMRCLDLLLGMESRLVYDISDAAAGSIPVEKALLIREDNPSMALLGAPFHYRDNLNAESFSRVLARAKEAFSPDYILLDTPGDPGGEEEESAPVRIAAASADRALIVATHQSSSVRAAEQTGRRLEALGVRRQHLIINEYRSEAVKKWVLPGTIDIIDRSALQLLAVIPHDERLPELQEQGKLAAELPARGWRRSNSAVAFANLAARVEGETIPLFTGFRGRMAQ